MNFYRVVFVAVNSFHSYGRFDAIRVIFPHTWTASSFIIYAHNIKRLEKVMSEKRRKGNVCAAVKCICVVACAASLPWMDTDAREPYQFPQPLIRISSQCAGNFPSADRAFSSLSIVN